MIICPGVFEKDITVGNYETYFIINDTNDTKLYKISANINDNIEVKIFPHIFILEPNEDKNVKVLLKPSSSLKDGAYAGNLLIEIIPVETKELNNIKLNIHMDILAYIRNKNPLI
ncbi:MAG: hypothetical protein ACRC0Y_08610 [Fusobacteriaceae bacterium]